MSEQVSVPADVSVTATVGGPELVTLYDAEGNALRVHAADADRLLARGWSRQTFDRKAAKKEALAMLRALREAIDGFVGEDDAAELEAVHVAASEANNALAALVDGVLRAMPPAEGEPVTLVDPSGKEHQVDPGQVDLYKAVDYRERDETAAHSTQIAAGPDLIKRARDVGEERNG